MEPRWMTPLVPASAFPLFDAVPILLRGHLCDLCDICLIKPEVSRYGTVGYTRSNAPVCGTGHSAAGLAAGTNGLIVVKGSNCEVAESLSGWTRCIGIFEERSDGLC